MKKGSFSIGSVVDFLKDNVEKFVFGLAVLVLLFLVANSFTQDKVGFTPEELQSAATNAKTHIVNGDVPGEDVLPPPDETLGRPLPPEASALVLDPLMFTLPTSLNSFARQNKGKRGTPTAEPMLVLRGSPMVGAIQVKPEDTGLLGAGGMGDMGGESYGGMGGMDEMGGMSGDSDNVKGRRFIVVTGLLPYPKQSEQYTKLFVGAEYQNLMVDRPNYVDYQVERAEVTGGRLNWIPIDVNQVGPEEMQTWAGFSPDVVPPEYILRFIPGFATKGMAFPLPPMINRTFGSEAACPPDIPLLSDAMLERQREQMELEEERRSQQDPSRIWGSAGMSGGMGGEMDGGYGGMEMDMGMDGGMDGGMGYESGYGMSSSMSDFTLKPKLFRYLDFTVEAGKSYTYRVKLVLANPNFTVPEQYLENPDDTDTRHLETSFCDPCDPITVPLDSRLLAVSVRAGSRPTDEPSCEMCCIFFDMELAKESSDIFSGLKRGKVVNYANQTFNEVRAQSARGMGGYGGGYDSEMGMGMEGPGGYGQSGRSGRTGRTPTRTTPSKIGYHTDVCILDMTGGDRLPGRSTGLVSLGGLLLMGADGQLEVRTEIGDYEEYSDYEPPERRPRGASPYGGGMDGEMMGDY